METKFIRVGSSIGLIVPGHIVKELEIKVGTKIEIELKKNEEIVIKKTRKLREGWDKAFAIYAREGEDELMIPDFVDAESDMML